MNLVIEPFEGFHAGAAKILHYIKNVGLNVRIEGGTLYVGPRSKMDDDLLLLIADHKPELTALVAVDDVEVAWRVGSMLRQLAGYSWPCPIPTLAAAPEVEAQGLNVCHSCAELIASGEGDSYVCGPCGRAKDIALDLWMQKSVRSEKVA